MSGQIKYCNKVWTANGCTHAHDDVAGQEIGTINSFGFKRTVACMFATPEPIITGGGGGGGGGGGPASPPRVPRVPVVPWAPKKVTYAQKAQPNPEMPGWMIEGKKLESEFNMIAEAEAAYKLVVETAIATKKAAETAAQEAYKAALEKAGGGGKKELTVHAKSGNWGDLAEEA